MSAVDLEQYARIQRIHKTLPSFSAYISINALPYLAFILLAATFTLAFYFSTLPKATLPARELAVASLASVLGGFGIVALFCSVGVYV